MAKFLDEKGLQHLWSKISMEDYPNNETLIAVLNAIDQTKLDKSVFEEFAGQVVSSVEPKDDDVPKIYINGTIPTDKTEVDAEMIYKSKTETFHAYIKIKCQGNSSMSYPKKNFTIKLFEDEERTVKLKKDMKGWGKTNKFVLKANWIDYSHARNIVSARIWSKMVEAREDYDSLPEELRSSPNNGAVDGFPIIVYCNNLYYGRYTWNIPKDKFLTNMDDDLETHCILASENYVSGCFRALAAVDETDWTDEIHDSPPQSIITSINNAISFVMNSSDEDFVNNIENYFDLNSLIDYYLLAYAICHLDGLGKNQLLLTYDGIHWIASAYDMDSTFGLYWNGESFVSHKYRMQSDYEPSVAHNTTNLLYERLEQLFKERIKERYSLLRTGVLNEINLIQMFEEFIDLIPPYKCEEDYRSTTANGLFKDIPSTASNHIGQIRDYIAKRLEYVDSVLISNTSSGFTFLRENYMPMGSTWMDTADLDLNNGDYIEISVNLSSCYGTNENIISIGDNIAGWEQNVAGYHIYFTNGSGNSGTMEIWSFIGSNSNRKTITVSTSTATIIKLDSNGVSINGSIQQTGGQVRLSSFQIGSMEGVGRSRAIYNYIKVYKN